MKINFFRFFAKRYIIIHVLLPITAIFCIEFSWAAVPNALPQKTATTIIDYQFRIVDSFPHSRKVFTQGLEYHNNLLYESAGLRGKSSVFIRTLKSTTPIYRHHLNKSLFAEGITLLNNQLYQLTWQSGRVFTYKADTLEPLAEFALVGEGWGLTNNGTDLIVSNGSHQLTFINPNTGRVKKKMAVTYLGTPLKQLNELEWINGIIYANVWQSNWIVMIDPSTGVVIGKVNLSNLLPNELRTRSTDVLNGIAYDKTNDRLFITGKNWPKIYHIELTANTNTGISDTPDKKTLLQKPQ